MNPYRHITPTSEKGVLILSVELAEVKDYVRAEELKFELSHAVRSAKTNLVVLDLRKMEFMTSLACVAFIGVKHAVRERQGRLILCNISDFIHKVLSAKRLLSPSQRNGHVAFEQAGTLDDAISLLTAERSSGEPDDALSGSGQPESGQPESGEPE